MKRKTLILSAAALAAAIGLGTTAYAHGPGWGNNAHHGMMMGGQGHGPMSGCPLMGGQGNSPMMGGSMMGGPMMGGQGYGWCNQGAAGETTPDNVKNFLENHLSHWGSQNLKVGAIAPSADGKTISGEIVTKDGSKVFGFVFEKATGRLIERN